MMANVARSKTVTLAKRTIQEFLDDQCLNRAASVAYFGFLSLFPLLLFLIAVFGQVLASPEWQDRILSQVGAYLPAARGFVAETINGVVEARGAIGAISFLTLLWSAAGGFGAASQAVNEAWEVKEGRPIVRQMLLNLGLALASGVFLLISIVLTGAFQFFAVVASPLTSMFPIDLFWPLAGLVVPFMLTLAVFLTIYKILPYREVRWKEALLGAVVATVLFEILKNIFGWYTANLSNYNAVYGSIGTAVILLTWIYFSSVILLLGAELSSVYAELTHGLTPKGAPARSPAYAPQGVPVSGTEEADAKQRPSRAMTVVFGIATVGLIAFRSFVSFREREGVRQSGLFGLLKKSSKA